MSDPDLEVLDAAEMRLRDARESEAAWRRMYFREHRARLGIAVVGLAWALGYLVARIWQATNAIGEDRVSSDD